MKKVLIVVDYQKDFVDGSLACGQDALDIEQGIYDKVQEYLKNGDQIIFTKDAHYANEYFDTHEHKLYPQHCLIDKNHLDTEGVNLYGKLLEFNEDDEDERWSILYKPSNMAIGIEDYIDQHSNLDIEICGLATDLCVMKTALYIVDFYNSKNVVVHVNSKLCASYDRSKHDRALEVMKDNGIIIL